VFIIIKPKIGESVSSSEKSRIKKELVKYKVGSIDVEITDSKGIEFVIVPNVIYETSKTRNREKELRSLINDFISLYIANIDFDSFGGLYSDLAVRCGIKDLDSAIKYVHTQIYLKQSVELTPGILKNYITKFYTKLKSNVSGEYYAISDFFCHKGVASPVFMAAKTKELIEDCSADINLYLITSTGTVLDIIGSINLETGELNYTVHPCDGSSQIINILVVPEVVEVEVGQDVVPSIEVSEILIYEDSANLDIATILDPSNISLPIIDIGDVAGDQNVVINPPPLITDGAGGGTVTIPSLPDATLGDPDSDGTDPVIQDPNNVLDIEDYTPETNPYSCS